MPAGVFPAGVRVERRTGAFWVRHGTHGRRVGLAARVAGLVLVDVQVAIVSKLLDARARAARGARGARPVNANRQSTGATMRIPVTSAVASQRCYCRTVLALQNVNTQS